MFQYVANLLLTYFFAMMFSGSVFTFITIRGRFGKKFVGLLFTLPPLLLMYYWGNSIDAENYKWWFIAILILNMIFQYKHIKKRIEMSRYM